MEKKQKTLNHFTSISLSKDEMIHLIGRETNLDTEQSAISTETEAVNKVISKNVETSFKTFNA